MNHDMVFWGVVVCVVGAVAVVGWLLFVAMRHFGGGSGDNK